jgi:hypothetical protein
MDLDECILVSKGVDLTDVRVGIDQSVEKFPRGEEFVVESISLKSPLDVRQDAYHDTASQEVVPADIKSSARL